jgi:hypothetical protein
MVVGKIKRVVRMMFALPFYLIAVIGIIMALIFIPVADWVSGESNGNR